MWIIGYNKPRAPIIVRGENLREEKKEQTQQQKILENIFRIHLAKILMKNFLMMLETLQPLIMYITEYISSYSIYMMCVCVYITCSIVCAAYLEKLKLQ